MQTKYITFGEVMARLMCPAHLRLRQAMPGSMDVTFGGSESNVAGAIALLGGDASYITVLPDNPIADACLANLASLRVDTSRVIRTAEGRLGLYFVETGANQRPSRVYYDRAGSAVSTFNPQQYDWRSLLSGADWFHVSGITPAISATAAQATQEAVCTAHEMGLRVSCDLNFRGKLWKWDIQGRTPHELAHHVMDKVLRHVHVLIANEADCADVLGISTEDTDVESGRLNIDKYAEVARNVCDLYPSITQVGITLRESVSADHNNWGAMLYNVETGKAHFAPLDEDGTYRAYEIRNIVDRVGAGDSFAAGLIYALGDEQLCRPEKAVSFAVSLSCLAHSIKGDLAYATKPEVEALMRGSISGRVVR